MPEYVAPTVSTIELPQGRRVPLMDDPTERQPLTRERVLDAAIELADREGVDALSMRRLGAELSVQAMSLYNHVANKRDLLDGVAGRLLARMEIPPASEATWEEGLRQVCRSYRRLAHDHPGLFPLVLARPLASPEVLPPLEATLTFLRKAGLDAQGALDVFQACASFVGGFALGEINEQTGRPAGTESDARDEWPSPGSLDDGGHYPVTAEVLRLAAPDRDRAFEVGLDLLIGGLTTVRVSSDTSAVTGARCHRRRRPAAGPAGGSRTRRQARLRRSPRTSTATISRPATQTRHRQRRRRP